MRCQGCALVAGVERLHEVAPRVHITVALGELGTQEARVECIRRIRDGDSFAQRQHVLRAGLVQALRWLLSRRAVAIRRDRVGRIDADVASRRTITCAGISSIISVTS